MAVFIFDRDAFDKMVSVEGEEYRKYKSKEVFGQCSFDAFYEEFNRYHSRPWQLRWIKFKRLLGLYWLKRDLDFGITVDDNGAIYGLYGWNRYTVRYSGEIWFIRAAARCKEDIVNAKKVGFRIF
jgi:hypothetical protein